MTRAAVEDAENVDHHQDSLGTRITALKQKGNQLLKENKPKSALKAYDIALEAAAEGHLDGQQLAVLYSNRAFAYIRCGQYVKAEADARVATKMAPGWPKPLHRLAQALQGQYRWEDAISACQQGMAYAGTTKDFEPLRNTLAVQAAQQGCFAGFPGRLLDVRDAGTDAWLCKEAPEDSDLDMPEGEEALLALPPATNAGSAPEGTSAQRDDPRNPLGFVRRGFSFRSVHAAMKAARDGDQIILRRGIHNGLGESVLMRKRVLIRGRGEWGETKVDHRGNCPAFRMSNASVLLNIDIDMTGYREALRFDGADPAGALVHECIIRCSGDDAVHVCGGATPRISRCKLQAKKCGLCAYDKARPLLSDCNVEECGGQGIKLFDHATVRLLRCSITKCEEDGIVAQDRSRIELEACIIKDCQGPALDLTRHAQASVMDCTLNGCSGAVWVWDKSKAVVRNSTLQAYSTYVVITHGEAQADIKVCNIDGKPYLAGVPQKLGLEAQNSVNLPDKHIGAPPEEGAFEFVPNPYTRKQ